MTAAILVLTPQGHVTLGTATDGPPLHAPWAERLTRSVAVDSSSGGILLTLGAEQVGVALPMVWGRWRDVAVRHLTTLCYGSLPEVEEHVLLDAFQHRTRASCRQARLVWSAPPMDGAEYLESVEVLHAAVAGSSMRRCTPS